MPGGLVALPGVYRPQADTLLLAEALAHEDLGTRTEAPEIGTGTGALALHAAIRGARVTAVDVSLARGGDGRACRARDVRTALGWNPAEAEYRRCGVRR
ncbi:hypothetical protein ACGFZK_03355 [Streptomyces sp. NPDC048257]|uniref:hypothetical protein n=1 Tax=Streptomyces sp. NPDC048257 TaxID=3365526 RepID=UPI0037224D0B